MSKTAIFMGVDVSARVVSYGAGEAIKQAQLATPTLVTSQYQLTLRNDDGAFSPYTSNSAARGRTWSGKSLAVTWDNLTVFDGLVRDIKPGPAEKTCVMLAESRTSGLALVSLSGSAQGVNPAEAVLGLLVSNGFSTLVNAASFITAAGLAKAAGATIDYSFGEGNNVTLLGMMNAVSDLTGIAFFERAGKIQAQAFRPYPGNESGLRFALTSANVREFGKFEWSIDSYYNTISTVYPDGTDTQQDRSSMARWANGKQILRQLGDDQVKAHDLASARYFGYQGLLRFASPKATMMVAAGSDFKDVVPGQRFPVTYSNVGLSRTPMEAISVKPRPDANEVELVLLTL